MLRCIRGTFYFARDVENPGLSLRIAQRPSSNDDCDPSKINADPKAIDFSANVSRGPSKGTETHLIRQHAKTRNEKARNERANIGGREGSVNTGSEKSAGNNLSGSVRGRPCAHARARARARFIARARARARSQRAIIADISRTMRTAD